MSEPSNPTAAINSALGGASIPGIAVTPSVGPSTCGSCGKPMRYNVPRLGPDGGYVHADTGTLSCSGLQQQVVSIPAASPAEALSQQQQSRMIAIEAATNLLSEAKVPFMMFASPDDVSPTMKFTSSHQLSYSSDLFSIPKEVTVARETLLGATLTQLTKGMRGGVALLDDSLTPFAIFRNGVFITLKQEKKVVI